MGNQINYTKPVIFIEGRYTYQDIHEFQAENTINQFYDIYLQQLEEYFEITHPELLLSSYLQDQKLAYVKLHTSNGTQVKGNWIYFPWTNILVHCIGEREYFQLRTNRNQLLIISEEQIKLSNTTIAVAGLSIGGNMAVSLAYSGISSTMKLADYDLLATTNLNRMRASMYEVGQMKLDIISHRIYEINPYANLVKFAAGINPENISDFVSKKPRPNIIIDALDDFEIKVRLRLEAKKTGIPVIMITSLGDTLIVDVERYDLDQNLELFNGKIGNIPEEILSKPITEEDKKKYAIAIVEKRNVSERALETVKNIGLNFVGRPQINSTVTVGSGIIAFLVKKIILGDSIQGGRKKVDFNIFAP